MKNNSLNTEIKKSSPLESANSAPIISVPTPFDDQTGVAINPTQLGVWVSDQDGDSTDVFFYDQNENLIGASYGNPSLIYATVKWYSLSLNKEYSWYVIASDGEDSTSSPVLSFTTRIENSAPDIPSNPYPYNNQKGLSITPTLSVQVKDADGDDMDVSFFNQDNNLIGIDYEVQSNSYASMKWDGLSQSTFYSWYAVANDHILSSYSDLWSFSTGSYQPSNPSPYNGQTGVSINVILSVYITNPDLKPVYVNFLDNNNQYIGSLYPVLNGTYASVNWAPLTPNTFYQWYVIAYDGKYTTYSPVWSFTTEILNYAPYSPINPSPNNGTTGVGLNPTLSVNVYDPDGGSLDVYFYDQNDASIGTVYGVSSGSSASISWYSLTPNTLYGWYVEVSDGEYNTSSSIWYFMTELENSAPDPPINPSPSNGTTGVGLNPTLSVNVYDPDGGSLDVYFYDQNDALIGTVYGISSGSSASIPWYSLSPNTLYGWYVKISDGEYNTSSSICYFITELENFAPYPPINPSPSNGTTGVGLNPTLSVNVYDPDGGSLDVYFYDQSDALIGTVYGVSSGSSTSISWNSLTPNTLYGWYVEVSDGEYNTSSSIWYFMTELENSIPSTPIGISGFSPIFISLYSGFIVFVLIKKIKKNF